MWGTQFTGYIGVGLCGALGTHFTGLVRACRLTPEMPFKGLFRQRSRSLGAQRSHLFLSHVLGPNFIKLGKGVYRPTLELPLRG
jgi:hypothetical protein